jgi:hypothetical protein
MSIKELLRHFGNNVSLCAREMGVGRTTVYEWIEVGEVPWRHQCVAQVVTNSELLADKHKTRAARNRENWSGLNVTR